MWLAQVTIKTKLLHVFINLLTRNNPIIRITTSKLSELELDAKLAFSSSGSLAYCCLLSFRSLASRLLSISWDFFRSALALVSRTLNRAPTVGLDILVLLGTGTLPENHGFSAWYFLNFPNLLTHTQIFGCLWNCSSICCSLAGKLPCMKNVLTASPGRSLVDEK